MHHSPYVPTKDDVASKILSHLKLKKGAKFIDLGAGDGRVVKIARDTFKLNAIGFEVNPMLQIYSKLRYGITLSGTNLFKAPISNADIIYIYLFPKLIAKLEKKLTSEAKKGAIIICYSFPILGLSKKLTHTAKIGKRYAFYYKI
jgi:hypothetical protein